jgi:hypothetical protein
MESKVLMLHPEVGALHSENTSALSVFKLGQTSVNDQPEITPQSNLAQITESLTVTGSPAAHPFLF